MKIVELPIAQLREAPWNPNRMDGPTLARLKESLSRYGVVQPLVVRPIGHHIYEVLSGNQRFKALCETRVQYVPCVMVEVDDAQAMLLAQALNGIRGEDDLALKGALLKKILSSIPEGEVLSLLPETAESLRALATIGQEDLAQHLQAWEEAQAARLKHMQLQFTSTHLETVERALDLVMAGARDSSSGNPNARGNAMYLMARFYLERNGDR